MNKSFRNEFLQWLFINLPKSTGTRSSYIRAIEVLSELLKRDVFSISDSFELSNLYNDLLVHQRDEKGKYYYKDASAYGNKGFYSAAIKKLILFHQESQISIAPENKIKETNPVFTNEDFINNCKKTNLSFQVSLISRFAASLLTKPFVILTGLSGSGKTKLAQAFAMWICENESQYKIVPVGADWTNREPLLGYPNALKERAYVKPESGALDLILQATKTPEKPFFLILDEMNLSHVERYFADFLSAMESGEEVLLHSGEENWDDVPAKISLPKNLFIVGTVNIDETTYMFSPKVLDRASVIEFRVTVEEMKNYLGNYKPLNMEALRAQGAAMGTSFVKIATDKSIATTAAKETTDKLLMFFGELKKNGAEFGYRSASEILRFAEIAKLIEPGWPDDEILDAAIMQKLLPKLHGSRNKLTKILPVLGGFCLEKSDKIKENYFDNQDTIQFETDPNIRYRISFEKICRMYKNAIENGYANYTEA